MKNKFKFNIFAIVIAIVMLSSCSYRLVDFTVISSKNHSLNFDLTQGKQVSASSNGFLGIGASIKDAMDKALQSAGPEYDILVNGVVRLNDYFFVSGYKVEGTALDSKKLKAMLGEEGYKEWLISNDLFNPSETIVMK
jgi:hypothetical protein